EWRQLFSFRGLDHLQTVFVGAGQEEYVLAVEPLKARQRIGCNRFIGVADMRRAIGIGDRGCDVERVFGGLSMSLGGRSLGSRGRWRSLGSLRGSSFGNGSLGNGFRLVRARGFSLCFPGRCFGGGLFGRFLDAFLTAFLGGLLRCLFSLLGGRTLRTGAARFAGLFRLAFLDGFFRSLRHGEFLILVQTKLSGL